MLQLKHPKEGNGQSHKAEAPPRDPPAEQARSKSLQEASIRAATVKVPHRGTSAKELSPKNPQETHSRAEERWSKSLQEGLSRHVQAEEHPEGSQPSKRGRVTSRRPPSRASITDQLPKEATTEQPRPTSP